MFKRRLIFSAVTVASVAVLLTGCAPSNPTGPFAKAVLGTWNCSVKGDGDVVDMGMRVDLHDGDTFTLDVAAKGYTLSGESKSGKKYEHSGAWHSTTAHGGLEVSFPLTKSNGYVFSAGFEGPDSMRNLTDTTQSGRGSVLAFKSSSGYAKVTYSSSEIQLAYSDPNPTQTISCKR